MKFLWQQIIVFLTVILSALALIAYQVEDYMEETIIENRYSQLNNYGQNIVNNNFSRDDLVFASQLLGSENILIQVYLPTGAVIYPTYDQNNKAQLNDDQISRLLAGEHLGVVEDTRLNAVGEPETYATIYLPHENVGEFPRGFISLGAPVSDLRQQLEDVRQQIYQSFVLAGIVGIALSIIYSLYQTRKIKRLQAATRQVAQGHYDVDLDTSGVDEFGDLARDFKLMAESLWESEREVDRQEQVRRQFMQDVSHEMRTPLTTMSGVLEGLQYDMIPEGQRERSLELVQKETQRLIRLVNENLDYEKIRSGEVRLKKSEYNALDVLQSIKEQLREKAAQKGIRIQIQADPAINVWADYDRLVQILINLVTNAIQFSQEAPIELSVRQNEVETIFEVKDYGIGMDEDHLTNIWERFYKVDESRKHTDFGESGIGLTVVKSLVEAHGGEVKVSSRLGQGSIFTVYLPNKKEGEV